MSRAPLNRSLENGRTSRVAALGQEGSHWRLVILERNGAMRLLKAHAVACGDVPAIRAALAEHGITTLLRIVGASDVICRVVEIPEGAEADMLAAAALMAEAELPGSVPSHRRAAGLVSQRGSSGHRVVVMVAWTGEDQQTSIGGIDEVWTPEPVALLSLLASTHGAEARWALSTNRQKGSIAIACSGHGRTALRTLREEGSDEELWKQVMLNQLRRTIESVGAESAAVTIGTEPASVVLDEESQRSLNESVAGFASVFGKSSPGISLALPLGAAVGFLSSDAAMRPLFMLAAKAPANQRPMWMRVGQWLAAPGNAAVAFILALLLILLVPLASAATRHSILVAKSGGMERQQEAERQVDARLALYQQLEARRWPMTKLAADLARLLPVGIVTESLRMDQGQRIALRGRAESLEVISSLQSAINASGVFAEASIDRQQMSDTRSGGGAFEFDLSARVVRPFAEAQAGEDFASSTLAERLYGVREKAPSAGDSGLAPATSGAASESGAATSARRRSSGQPSAREREGGAAPEPVTDEQISAMDRTTAMKEWTKRQSASRDSRFDESTRERLKSEAEKAKARFTSLREGSS